MYSIKQIQKFHRKELVLSSRPSSASSCKTRFGLWCQIYQLAKFSPSNDHQHIWLKDVKGIKDPRQASLWTGTRGRHCRHPSILEEEKTKHNRLPDFHPLRCQLTSKAVFKTPCEIEIPVGWQGRWQGSLKCLIIVRILNWIVDSYNSSWILIIVQSYWINGMLLQFLLFRLPSTAQHQGRFWPLLPLHPGWAIVPQSAGATAPSKKCRADGAVGNSYDIPGK